MSRSDGGFLLSRGKFSPQTTPLLKKRGWGRFAHTKRKNKSNPTVFLNLIRPSGTFSLARRRKYSIKYPPSWVRRCWRRFYLKSGDDLSSLGKKRLGEICSTQKCLFSHFCILLQNTSRSKTSDCSFTSIITYNIKIKRLFWSY